MKKLANPLSYYGKPLWTSVLGWSALIGVALALGGETFRAGYWKWLAVNGGYLAIITFMTWLVFDARDGRFKLPKVRKLIDDLLIFVCDPEDWLGYGANVAIFHQEGDYERPLAQGLVFNIQSNGLVQIKVSEHVENDENEFAEKVKAIQLKDILIKPGQDWKR